MSSKRRCLHYEKSIVLNALYGAIDVLGLSLESANSMRGTLIVSDAEHTGKTRIALVCVANKDQTQVEFYPEGEDVSFTEKWSHVILDEIEGRIRQVVSKVKM